MKTELLDLLDDLVQTVRGVVTKPDVEGFAEQLRARRPELFSGLPGGKEGELAGDTSRRLARKMLELVGGIPSITTYLGRQIGDPHQDPAMRLMYITATSYLVTPLDLLDDELPAGFGFVDDTLMLYATEVARRVNQYRLVKGEHELGTMGMPRSRRDGTLDELRARIAEGKAIIDFLGMAIPREVAPRLEAVVEDVVKLLAVVAMLPPFMIDAVSREMLKNPLIPLGDQDKAGDHFEALRSLPHFPTQTMLYGGRWFALPEGTLSRDEDDALHYRFADGTGVTLRQGALIPIGEVLPAV